jgi:CHAD domain-containing protein
MRKQRYELFRKRLDALTRDAQGIYEGDVAALHATRVASRRLRELLPTLELDAKTARDLQRRLKKFTKALGAVRELDVMLLLIQELHRNPDCSRRGLKHVGALVRQAQAAAHERLVSRFPLDRIHRLTRRLERAGRHLNADDRRGRTHRDRRPKRAWLWMLDAQATRRAARVQSAIQSAGAVYRLEGLHEVRIALKKLRYAAELGAEARQTRSSADIAALKTAQDLLGRLHDQEVLITRIRQAQVSLSPPNLTIWRELASLVRAIEDDCRALHARYIRDRPKLMAIAGKLGEMQEPRPEHGNRAVSRIGRAQA